MPRRVRRESARSFVEELCIALAHQWEPERLFVIFTADFDESDTHGHAPCIIMGGFLGHAYQWKVFNRDLNRVRADFGFRIFHATDFKHRRGEFKGWSDEKWLALPIILTDLVHRRLTEGVTVDLPHSQYLDRYKNLPFPPKMRPDTQYGLCFRVCLGHFVEIIAARGGKNHTLHIVIEDGHKNVGDTKRVFDELKDAMAWRGVNLLGTITIAKKSERDELMVADFLSHTYSLMRAADPALPASLPDQDAPADRPRGKAGLTYLQFRNETFQDLKDIFVREKAARHEDYLRRKTASDASKKKGESS